MRTDTSQLREARERLAYQTFSEPWDFRTLASRLESLAGMFARTTRDQHRELAAQFHDCAGKLPYVDDCDYGALVLESAAEDLADVELRSFLVTEARFRVTWCVQAATAGGEAIARSRHLKRLDEKVQHKG